MMKPKYVLSMSRFSICNMYIYYFQENVPTKQWKEWNPKMLREAKHKALRTSASIQKPVTKNTLNTKLEEMIDARSEVIRLQRQQLTGEDEFTTEEKKLKLELLRLEIQKAKLNIHLLEKQVQQ